jgi:mannose-6-phosphate isomerase-like protein (cupin superfamily)
MHKVLIQNLSPDLVNGIQVQLPDAGEIEKELYFEWSPSNLITQFKTNSISGGLLSSSKSEPIFKEIESHIDAEMFYFISGTAFMLFIDIKNNKPIIGTAQIVRIQQGTQLIIPAGKGHFVPVPEGDDSIEIIVVAPKMGDIKAKLPMPIEGIKSKE